MIFFSRTRAPQFNDTTLSLMRIRWYHIYLYFIFVISPIAHAQDVFDQRFEELKVTLEEKASDAIPGLLEKTRFSVVDATIHDLLRGLAEAHQLNISVSPSIRENVSNNFTDVVVKDLILFLCREYWSGPLLIGQSL